VIGPISTSFNSAISISVVSLRLVISFLAGA